MASQIGHNNPPIDSADGIVEFPTGMPKMHYFQCDIAALRKAIIDKPLDVRGAYISALLAMYEYMEPLPADDKKAQARLGITDARVYKRMKRTFIQHGWLHERPSGALSNARFEEEITAYVVEFRNRSEAGKDREEKARAERAKVNTTEQSFDLAKPELTPSYGLAKPQLEASYGLAKAQLTAQKSEKLNEINDRQTSNEVPVRPHIRDRDRYIRRNIRKDSPLPPQRPAFEPRPDEVCVGGNVWVNCETVRHPGFTISLPGLTMQLVTANIGLSKKDAEPIARDAAIAHALQWGVEIDAGKLSSGVVPSNPANFIRGSIVSQHNRALAAKAGSRPKLRRV